MLAVRQHPSKRGPRGIAPSGAFVHGQAFVVTGSGFGTKSTAPPLVWADFSDGTAGSLTAHGYLTTTNATDLRHPRLTYNARADFKVAGPGSTGHFWSYDSSTSSRWFVQYWIKLASNWHWGTTGYEGGDDGLYNVKIFRLYPTARDYSNIGYSFYGGTAYRFFEHNTEDDTAVAGVRALFTFDTWHLVQIEYGENRGVDQANGHTRLWIDGTLRDSSDTINTNDGADGSAVNKRPFIMGFFDSWPPSDAAVSNMYAYYSELYVDNAWARVELGNNSVYADCTVREMQIPATSGWADTSIIVTANAGAFTTGQTAYLHVIDAEGTVHVPTNQTVTIG